MKSHTFNEIKNEFLGELGTEKRDNYEQRLEDDFKPIEERSIEELEELLQACLDCEDDYMVNLVENELIKKTF